MLYNKNTQLKMAVSLAFTVLSLIQEHFVFNEYNKVMTENTIHNLYISMSVQTLRLLLYYHFEKRHFQRLNGDYGQMFGLG